MYEARQRRNIESNKMQVMQRILKIGADHVVTKEDIKKGIVNIYKTEPNGTIAHEQYEKLVAKEEINTYGEEIADYLYVVYRDKTYMGNNIILDNYDSLNNQLKQDVYFACTDELSLIGIPHQHNEYRRNGNAPTIKYGHNIIDMRIYRTMPLFAWEQAKLGHGHGGSIGEAMYYFEIQKEKLKSIIDNGKKQDRNFKVKHCDIYVMVEFTLSGKKLGDMINKIENKGEGSNTDDKKFGAKTEIHAAFGMQEKKKNNIFSVYLKNSEHLIQTFATSRIVASIDSVPRSASKPGNIWTNGLAEPT